MTNPTMRQIVKELRRLTPEQQERVLDFAHTLASPPVEGVPGRRLLALAGVLSPNEARNMSQAVERECERVEVNGW